MGPIVADANRRFELSKALLDRAKRTADNDLQRSLAEMAITSAFSCLEGMLTHVFEHFVESTAFDIFEQSVMQEKSIRFVCGRPSLTDQRFHSIEDRLQFLFWRFSGREFDKNKTWWPHFSSAVGFRNEIMHPKAPSATTVDDAERSLSAIVSAIDDLMMVVFRKRWPKAKRGLTSSLSI